MKPTWPLLTILVALASTLAHADDSNWTRWRGPEDNGSTQAGTYPAELNETTLLWKAPLPGKGCSTPIVLDGTIYLTAPVDGNDALLAFDWSGNLRWQTSFGPETPGKHRNGSGCNGSPATDGDAVFVHFKSGTLAAVGLDGTVRWKTNLVERFGEDERFWDNGTSPVVTEKHVVMARMHAGDSWLAAFDKRTGELAWKVSRNYPVPLEGDQCYTTPILISHDGAEGLLVWASRHLTIHNAADGKITWLCGGFNPDDNKLWPAIANPVIVDNMIVLCYGRNDRRDPRLHGIRLDGTGDVTSTNRIWTRTDASSFVPTPAAYQGNVYLLRDRGEIECLKPTTGETIWSDAFPEARASFYASPTIAGDKLYAAREDGIVFVPDIGNSQFKLLGEYDMHESVIASPVPVSNHLFIRGEKHLFCFAQPETKP